jgi:hypothetical protein
VERRDSFEGRTLASESATLPPPRRLLSRQRLLLVGLPVALLFAKGAITLGQLVSADQLPDRVLLAAGMAVLSVIAALLLLAGGRIGWLLAVVLVGGDLAGELVLWWLGEPDYRSMALLALCAVLLTTREMRSAHVGPASA